MKYKLIFMWYYNDSSQNIESDSTGLPTILKLFTVKRKRGYSKKYVQ